MDCRGKRRCISKIHCIKIVQAHSLRNAHNGDIRHFIYCACPKYLDAEQFFGRCFCNQFYDKRRCSWIIMCFIIYDTDCRNRLKASRLSLFLGQPGAPAVQIRKQPHNACAQTAAIAASHAVNCFCHRTRGKVCRGTHCRPLVLPGLCVFYHCTVSDGIDIFQVRLHLRIG